MKKIKVIQVLTDKNIGGAGRWLLNYLKYYDRDKFLVTVILPKGSMLSKEIDDFGVYVMELDELSENSYDKNSIKILKKIFEEEEPDIVHTHASLSARIAAKKAGVKLVINTKHCIETESGNIVKRFVKRIINNRYSGKIIAVSNAVKESMIKAGNDESKIKVIYNGIELPEIKTEEQKQVIKENFGLSSEYFYVGIVARLEKVKDHDTFLKAVKIINNKNLPIKFLIIGDGSLKQTLINKVKDENISNIEFMGFVRNVEDIISVLNLSVLTSESEALSISLIESLALEVPVIGTNTGGIPEVICAGENGEIFPVKDAELLAKKILNLYEDTDLYNKYKENSSLYVKNKFSADFMTKEIEKLYLENL